MTTLTKKEIEEMDVFIDWCESCGRSILQGQEYHSDEHGIGWHKDCNKEQTCATCIDFMIESKNCKHNYPYGNGCTNWKGSMQ